MSVTAESFSQWRLFASTSLAPSSSLLGLLHRHVAKEGCFEHFRGVKAEYESRHHEYGSLEAPNIADEDHQCVHFPLVFVLLV